MSEEIIKEDLSKYIKIWHSLENLEYGAKLQRYTEAVIQKTREEVIEDIKKLENPYPKDIFVWDSKKKLDFNRGRFNQHCLEVVENTKRDIIKIIKETRGED